MNVISAKNNKPKWLDTDEYPFESRYIQVGGHNLHYIDEGRGDVLLFVHGTPTWSFDYRNLIKKLSRTYRCIALDHIGFGLSDKPDDYDYSTQNHSNTLSLFIETLKLKNINLVVHDFGGPIGLSYAVNNRDNIQKIIAMNTWAWSTEGEPEYEKMKKILESPLLPFLYKKLNFSPKYILPKMYGKKHKLKKDIKAQYVKPFGNAKQRNGALGFVKSLLQEQEWFASIWKRISSISSKPILLIWGLEDQIFNTSYLKKFEETFENSQILKLAECGHFPQEEASEAVSQKITQFLG